MQGMQEWPWCSWAGAGGISWHCSPGTAKGAACSKATSSCQPAQGWRSNWEPALEVNPGENPGEFIPHPQTAAGPRGLGGKVPWLHLCCSGRASSAGSREQQGSWEWNRKVQVTQIFLAQSTAGGS